MIPLNDGTESYRYDACGVRMRYDCIFKRNRVKSSLCCYLSSHA